MSKQITDIGTLTIDTDYLLFIDYDYSPSGFEIARYNYKGQFELQGSGAIKRVYEVRIYNLPNIPNGRK